MKGITRTCGPRWGILHFAAVLFALTVFAASVPLHAKAADTPQNFSIVAGSLGDALNQLARQSGLQILYAPELVAGKKAAAVHGTRAWREVLQQLLDGTGLTYGLINGTTVVIRKAETPPVQRVEPQARRAQTPQKQDQPPVTYLPEMLVKGTRTLDTDIPRTRDDIQPYVVFSAEDIQRSGAVTIEDFLKTRLPMNAMSGSFDQLQPNSTYVQGGINLRGLGSDQTLVLVDGRRMPGVDAGGGGNFSQPNLNGIPMAAIERIEVLPSTAGGIYGGSATGGVINVILKRDYNGANLKVSYGNTSRRDMDSVRYDFNASFAPFDGRTRITLAASHSQAGALEANERDFAARGRALLAANNPDYFYGGTLPPVGSTANICAGRQLIPGLPFYQCSGAPLTLLDGTPLGATITYVPPGYAGPSSDSGHGLVDDAGSYNLAYPTSSRYILRQPKSDALMLDLHQQLSSWMEAYLDLDGFRVRDHSDYSGNAALGGYLPAGAPGNPFQQGIYFRAPYPDYVRFPVETWTKSLRALGGAIFRLPGDWSASLEYGWQRATSYGAYTNPPISTGMGLGPINVEGVAFLTSQALQDLQAHPVGVSQYLLPVPDAVTGPSDTVLRTTTLHFGGPVLHLPGGPLTLTGQWEHRDQLAEANYAVNPLLSKPVEYFPERSQTTDSTYLEFRAPLVGKANSRTGIDGLELMAAVRRDVYHTHSVYSGAFAATREGPFAVGDYATTRFAATTHTLGLRYAPTPSVALRASMSTGFLPPSLSQLIPSGTPTVGNLGLLSFYNPNGDPRRGNTPLTGDANGQILITDGGNPDLLPEHSKSRSAGIILTPTSLPGLRVSLDYTDIRKTGEVYSYTAYSNFLLAHESDFPDRVIRGPNLPGDPPDWAGPVIGLVAIPINLSRSRVSAWDIQADYSLDTRFGNFRPYLVATRTTRFERQLIAGDPTYSILDYSDAGAPLPWRGNLGLTWQRGPWAVDWNMQYYDGYSIEYADPANTSQNPTRVLNQGTARIPSQSYHDLYVRYRFDDRGGIAPAVLRGVEISLNVRNLFDRSPPILADDNQLGGYSFYGDPRLRRFMLTLSKQF